MLKVNEYFDGKVKSIGFSTPDCPATVGVMAPGEYEFGTSSVEYVTVVSGMMTMKLPGDKNYRDCKPYDTFVVPKDSRFQLRITADAAYVCLYK
jgi:uncharacterized protein YaiE (UPF0345 family)